MSKNKADHRRHCAWHAMFISCLSACYWNKILKRREKGLLVLKIVVAIAVFFLTISQYGILAAALITLFVSVSSLFFLDVRTCRVKGFCHQWADLRYDSDRLWREGENLGWNREIAATEIERLDGRIRACEREEFEDPNNKIVLECENDLYSSFGLDFRHKGENTNE